ncbi:uncharacterized protein LOC135073563 [Ostrinia nubilalis]|uniref:uncharacterized protein LOC135073563 n=1 Tax=Ostrinia nubilalis TaxID=29057 RepID=UPI0030825209
MKYMILLGMILRITRSQEIKLESLADGPGLLPHKLGPMRLTTHHHTFIQYVQLDLIQEKVDSIQTQLTSYKSRLINDTHLLYETQIDYLTEKLGKVSVQLKSLEPNRVKRGIVDGLGSVIKSITGNLDHSDAIKYNKAINLLKSNQDKIVSELNNHISINKEWISEHDKILTQIVDNQNKINTTIELILKSNVYNENSLVKYARLAQLLIIISENVEDLAQELIRLENSLAFIRASSTHHSMIDVDTLRSMIIKLKNIYGNEQVLNLEIRQYYDVIKPGSYYTDNQIVFIYKFPIVSREIYSFYHLSIVPNRNNQALIPSYPFLATNEISFMYIETECPKLSNWYLCGDATHHQLRSKPDCINELIVNQILKENCEFSTVTLKKEAMEKLDDQHYVLSFPQPSKVQLLCGRRDYTTLQGSYLITIPVGCHLKTTEFTITNDNDEIRGQPLKLTEIPSDTEKQIRIASHINLNSIDLQGLHRLQDKITMEAPINITDIPLDVYHTTIPFYVILLASSILAIFIAYRRFNKKRKDSQTKKKEEHPAPSGDQQHHDAIPATFSLNVTK